MFQTWGFRNSVLPKQSEKARQINIDLVVDNRQKLMKPFNSDKEKLRKSGSWIRNSRYVPE